MTADSDAFSVQLLEEAKRFLELAGESKGRQAHLHAALMLGFSALEAHVNGLADEIGRRPDTDLLEKSLLTESAITFASGTWKLGKSQYFRLEDRISFLFRRYGKVQVNSFAWWSDLKSGIDVRNSIVHPRDAVTLKVNDVQRYLTAIVDALNELYLAVFQKGHPAHGRGLDSTLAF